MIRFLILLAVLFAIALGFHRLKGTAGEVSLTMNGTAYVVDITTAALGLIVLVVALLLVILILRALFRAPHRLGRRLRRRNAEKANWAVSQGLVAIASGDGRTAERAALEAARRAPGQPLTLLLEAQAAQLRGDRNEARRAFAAMAAHDATRSAGLRGLYIEAEREGEHDAARQFAEQARSVSAAAPWASRALLQHQSAEGDWDGALRTLSSAAEARVIDKPAARRQRAVLLAAQALADEDSHPDVARSAATEAHELAPGLVPAAVVAGRLLARQGDIRRATRILESAWKHAPHPEIAEAYAHVRHGDSAQDRLKRMETLHRLRPHADEGRLALARAAIEARDFARAREVLAPVLTSRPTQNALFVMADLAEAESGDHGRAREWIARAVRAPRDPVWTADGMVLEHWAPLSPVTGRIDAVEWKVPVAEIAGPALDIDEAALRAPEPVPPPPRVTPPPPAARYEHPVATRPAKPVAASAAPTAAPNVPASIVAADAPALDPTPAAPKGNGATARRSAETAPGPAGDGLSGGTDEIEPAIPARLPDDPGVADEPGDDEVQRGAL